MFLCTGAWKKKKEEKRKKSQLQIKQHVYFTCPCTGAWRHSQLQIKQHVYFTYSCTGAWKKIKKITAPNKTACLFYVSMQRNMKTITAQNKTNSFLPTFRSPPDCSVLPAARFAVAQLKEQTCLMGPCKTSRHSCGTWVQCRSRLSASAGVSQASSGFEAQAVKSHLMKWIRALKQQQ